MLAYIELKLKDDTGLTHKKCVGTAGSLSYLLADFFAESEETLDLLKLVNKQVLVQIEFNKGNLN